MGCRGTVKREMLNGIAEYEGDRRS